MTVVNSCQNNLLVLWKVWLKFFFLLLPCCEIWHLTPPLVLRMINWKQNHKINFCPLRRDLHNEGETALNREIRKNTNKRIYRKVQMSLSCYKGNFYFYSWQGDQWIKPAEAFNNLFWSCDFQQGKEPFTAFLHCAPKSNYKRNFVLTANR